MPSKSSREEIRAEADLRQGKRRDFLWLGLLVLVATSFWGLTWDTQPYLSPDDMGKDLYPFERTLQGQWPCRDFYWQYGPLMLFYYAFWLKAGGVHLLSIRMGYSALYLLSSILSYRTLRLFVSPPISFLASLSFLIQGMYYPYYNFNHIGAVPFLLLSIFSLWKYFSGGEIRWCYFGTLTLVGMVLVKWNTGAASFLAFLGSLFLFRRFSKKRHWILLSLLFGGTALGVYLVQYSGCREAWVRECFGLGIPRIVHQNLGEIRNSFKHFILWFLVWDRKRLGWLGLFFVFGILGFLGLRKRGWNLDEKKGLLGVIASLFLFGFFMNGSDFFLTGMIYRIDFWSFPILVLLMGLAAEWAKSLFTQKIKVLLGGVIFLGVLALPVRSVKEAFASRVPERYLDFPRGRVYLVKETLSTVEVIKKVTEFILENTKPDEEILILPKEPLYCFLSGRRHVGRELHFEFVNELPDDEEQALIRQIETKKIPLVLLSNRDESNRATAKGEIGWFGKTHLRKMGEYVFEHYEEVETFGTWETATPRIHHAIRIFQRKP